MRRIKPLDVYRLLPRTNCGRCGERSCLAFAMKLLERVATPEGCSQLSEDARVELIELLTPPVREVSIGIGKQAVRIGGEEVLYRHELTFFRPTALAFDVADDLSEDQLVDRIRAIKEFCVERLGVRHTPDLIAVRNSSSDPERFAAACRIVSQESDLPLVLCSLKPEALAGALDEVGDSKPLVYAATKENWAEVCRDARKYACPVAVLEANIARMKALCKALIDAGAGELVLDPVTAPESLAATVERLILLRRVAVLAHDNLLGFPTMGVPASVWVRPEANDELTKMKEACVASALVARYASLLIMHSLDAWVTLPLFVWRGSLYSDPRKPSSVEPGLYRIGKPDESSPVLLTSNFALTYHIVSEDVKRSGIDSYLLVVDTGGFAVSSAVAGRRLTAQAVRDLLEATKMASMVKHRKLIIPGSAAKLKGEIEDLTGWEVIVGPPESGDIPRFLRGLQR